MSIGQEFEICPMTFEDIPVVAEIEKACFSMPWSEKAYEDTLANENAIYLIAKEKITGKIVGMCGVLDILGEGDVSNVAVSEEYRHKGIASSLMQELLDRGTKKGIEAFTLEVRSSNEAAIALYQSFGFESAGVRPRFYEKPVEDALIMWKR